MARRSVGGQVVENSLRVLGEEKFTPTTSLVETTLQAHLDVVLVQNAWNVVDLRQFVRLLKPYPARWQSRVVLRRLITQANLRRSSSIVCLTQAVADMVPRRLRHKVVITPVAFPLAMQFPTQVPPPTPGTALVVGAISWYKRPILALEVLARHAPQVQRVTFLGKCAHSRVWREIEHRAAELGLAVEKVAVPHSAVPARYSNAEVTVLPSALESLGFGVVEALAFGHRVMVSDIPAHRDAAAALRGRQPEWFDSYGSLVPRPQDGGARVSRDEVVEQWSVLRDALIRSAG